MVSANVMIRSPKGLHMRPAGNLAEHALLYKSNIFLEYGDKQVSAKSLLGILSLCIRQDTEIRVACDGEDEQEALSGMVDYISHSDEWEQA